MKRKGLFAHHSRTYLSSLSVDHYSITLALPFFFFSEETGEGESKSAQWLPAKVSMVLGSAVTAGISCPSFCLPSSPPRAAFFPLLPCPHQFPPFPPSFLSLPLSSALKSLSTHPSLPFSFSSRCLPSSSLPFSSFLYFPSPYHHPFLFPFLSFPCHTHLSYILSCLCCNRIYIDCS